MRECQAVVAGIPLPLPLLCHCSPQRCCRRRCCGDASTGAPRRSGERREAIPTIKRIASEELGPGQRYTIQARKQIAVALRKVRSDIAIKIRWCLAQRGIQGHNRQASCWKCFSRRSMYCGAETVFGFGVCALGFVEDTITHRGLNSQAGPLAFGTVQSGAGFLMTQSGWMGPAAGLP